MTLGGCVQRLDPTSQWGLLAGAIFTTRYFRAIFIGTADMQQQETDSDKTLDPTRELALL